MTISIKLAYDGKNRLVKLYVEDVDLTISSLMDTAKHLFPNLEGIDNEKLSFQYYDKDGDIIMVSTNKELKVALNEIRGVDDRKDLKFEIITIMDDESKSANELEESFQYPTYHPASELRTRPGIVR